MSENRAIKADSYDRGWLGFIYPVLPYKVSKDMDHSEAARLQLKNKEWFESFSMFYIMGWGFLTMLFSFTGAATLIDDQPIEAITHTMALCTALCLCVSIKIMALKFRLNQH